MGKILAFKALCALAILSFFSLPAQPLFPLIESSSPYFADGRLLLKFHPEARVSGLVTHVASLDHILLDLKALALNPIYGEAATYQLELPKGTDILHALASLRADPAVESVEPDYLAHAITSPNDPNYPQQWGLSKINIESAWTQTNGSPTAVIAILDSGIDPAHPDLISNLWTNPGEVAGDGIDNDNNGFVDDIYGWNFVNNSNDVSDPLGHGTLVSGVAAAVTDNNLGIAGLCGQCRIMPVVVMNSSGVANYSDIAAGINYAVAKGARVINLSLGGYSASPLLKNAVDAALAAGVTLVGGAGNDSTSNAFYPAAYPGVIGVAGTQSDDTRYTATNYGSWVSVSAPAKDILSTALGGDDVEASGTSMAAPFVSGLSGLLITLHPDWTPAMIRAQLVNTAIPIDNLNPGYESKLGAGRIDAFTAIQLPHPSLSFSGYAANGTSNDRPDFNSDISLSISVANDWSDAIGATGILSSTDPGVTITSGTGIFGTIQTGQTRSSISPFGLHIGNVGYSHTIPLHIALNANNGDYSVGLDFNILTRGSEEAVFGTQPTGTVWTSDKIYKVTNNINVPIGATLTIQPGTLVKIAGNFAINVRGTLLAAGTPAQPINFEPYTSGQTWDKLYYDDSAVDAVINDGDYQSGNLLSNVNVQGAANGITCNNSSPYFKDLSLSGSNIACTEGATDVWVNSTFLTGSLAINGTMPVHLISSDITGTTSLPSGSEVKDSTFANNVTISGSATILGGTVHGGSLSMGSGSIYDTKIYGGNLSINGVGTINGCTIMRGGITAGSGSTISGNDVENAPATGISSAGSSLVLNRVVDSVGTGISASSGTVQDNLVSRSGGDGLQIGAATVIENTVIGTSGRSAVFINGGVPVSLENNNFEYNSGPYDIYNNVPMSTASAIYAQNNWWGTTSLNDISLRIYDYIYDDTKGAVNFTPVLNNPAPAAPAYVRSVTLNPPSPVGIQSITITVQFSRPMDQAVTPVLAAQPGNLWNTKVSMAAPRYEFGAASATNGMIYAVGGITGGAVEEYNPATNSWRPRANMLTPRWGLGVVAAANGKIYAIGGDLFQNTYNLTSNIVEEYDPAADTWRTRASMPSARSDAGVVTASNGKIYVVGGMNGGWGATKDVQVYDPETNSWTMGANLPIPMSGEGVAASSNGKIYAIGGFGNGSHTESRKVEEYDIATNHWTARADLPTARYWLGAATADNGKIDAIGGAYQCFMCDAAVATVEEYDPAADAWRTLSNMPTARYHLAVTSASNGKIYAIGGGDGGPSTTVEELDPQSYLSTPNDSLPAIWVDDAHYRYTVDVTSLMKKGLYTLSILGAQGTDGVTIIPDSGTTFTVDYAGSVTDFTPPPAPAVRLSANGSLTSLETYWIQPKSPQTITAFRYAIGTTPGASDVVGWTELGPGITHLLRTGLNLLPGVNYYVSVKTRNSGGLWSPSGISQGSLWKSTYLPVLRR